MLVHLGTLQVNRFLSLHACSLSSLPHQEVLVLPTSLGITNIKVGLPPSAYSVVRRLGLERIWDVHVIPRITV